MVKTCLGWQCWFQSGSCCPHSRPVDGGKKSPHALLQKWDLERNKVPPTSDCLCDELNWNWNLAQEWDKISILYWKYLRFWFWLIWVDLKVIWARLLLIHRSDPDLTARPRPRSKQSLSMVCCKVSICCLGKGKVHVWCMYMSQCVGTTPTWG